MKIFVKSIPVAALALFLALFSTACSRMNDQPDAGAIPFSISASNVDHATVTLVTGQNAVNPNRVDAVVEVHFSPAGTIKFSEFVQSHTNQPVQILIGPYADNVMFRGNFSNLVHRFDFHCASSNEAQSVADLLNKKP